MAVSSELPLTSARTLVISVAESTAATVPSTSPFCSHFELRGGASVARGYPRVRVHGEREIPMDQVDLAAAHVIFHQPAIRGGEQGLAGWTLKIAEDLHGHGSVLRAKGFVRIHVGNIRRVLRGGLCRPHRASHQYAEKNCSGQNAPMFHTILRNSLSDLPLRVSKRILPRNGGNVAVVVNRSSSADRTRPTGTLLGWLRSKP